MKWKRCRNQDICKRYICEEDIGQKKLIYTLYAISGSRNVGKPEMQVHALNKFPIALVFHNIELYLNIGCKPNADNTN